MKKVIFLIIFVILSIGIFLFWNDFYSGFFLKLPEIEKEVRGLIKEEVEKEISLPPPLKAEREYPEAILTNAGIIEWTNFQREKYGVLPLKENPRLNASAAIKVEDMFKNQYFSHYSPNDQGVGDLAKIVGYDFILIGENLALGNFKDDQSLVLSWMESPGHRENILNPKYQEIGVAVEKGVFEGKETWIAVQHFGLPISACPQPDKGLLIKIEENQNQIEEIEKSLKELRLKIRAIRPKWGENLRQKVEEYNLLVSRYNFLIDQTEFLIKKYNNQVSLFNECLAEVK
jgi:hypothetical protein